MHSEEVRSFVRRSGLEKRPGIQPGIQPGKSDSEQEPAGAEEIRMRNIFFNTFKKMKRIRKKTCMVLAVLIAAACLLNACGPEPGAEEPERPMFGEESQESSLQGEETGAAEGGSGQDGQEREKPARAEEATTNVDRAETGDSSTADPAGAFPFGSLQGSLEKMSPEDLAELEKGLNDQSSYGFLLSVYDKPEEIDLDQVFYEGAGFQQEKLSEKEKKLLLDRISLKELSVPVTKVTEDQIDDLLTRKAGITYQESDHKLDSRESWAHIGRYKAWYHLHEDSNRRDIQCLDAWTQGDSCFVHYILKDESISNYQPVYEALLRKTKEGWQFCSNILWIQKNLIEAQSYRADLDPVGEVFFAPCYPHTEKDEKADVCLELIQDGKLLADLEPMEEGNIRTDRIFEGVDSVDFTDFNKDGYTDILTVCSYTLLGPEGRKTDAVREARVYTGQEEGVPSLDRKKTREVNSRVQTLNMSAIEKYLAGKSDGKDKKYKNWKEAYADQIKTIDEKEYDGFALIYLNDDRVPELVQIGATSAKGATIVVYHGGILEETWLNRREFRYLEYENLLLSASGMENLHYDTIYTVSGGRLRIAVQGYYGNKSFARLQFDDKGEVAYDYIWDGGTVSKTGYRDGLMFVFDRARSKSMKEKGLSTSGEILKELEKK